MPASEFDDENESSKEKLEDSEDDGGLSIFGIPIPKIPFPILSFGKFIYSEKATKFCEIFTLLLSYIVPVKSKVKISQNFVAFSEYMNFPKMNDLSC